MSSHDFDGEIKHFEVFIYSGTTMADNHRVFLWQCQRKVYPDCSLK